MVVSSELEVASPGEPFWSSPRTLLPAPAESARPAKKRAQKERVVAKRRPLFCFGAACSGCCLGSGVLSHSSHPRPKKRSRLVKEFRRGIAFAPVGRAPRPPHRRESRF